MKVTFDKAKWIWTGAQVGIDEYGDFYSEFEFSGKKTELVISADTNYAVYLNGELCTFGQYADYPHDKVYDVVDITDFCKRGRNSLAIIVWYLGIGTTQVYYPGNAALMFEVFEDGVSVLASSEQTLSRKSVSYVHHRNKMITPQLGPSFTYDATQEDAWMSGELCGFTDSCLVQQNLPLRPRPNKKLELGEVTEGKLLKSVTPCDVIYDLGVNTVGFFYIEAECESEEKILVAYGEHIADGCVRRLVGPRDFSVEITLKKGRTVYMNPFRRLGAKYLEVFSQNPISIKKIGIGPTSYPIEIKPAPAEITKAQREIYDTCVRTLTLCMHEHYEDCPWREQALYCMDSRNQMLCGYYAFGEYQFPRSCLELISKERRADDLLGICYPMIHDYAIPSFSLHYFAECREYLDYSGDMAFIREIYPKLKSILDAFLGRMQAPGALLLPFADTKRYWNFYEWTDNLALDDEEKLHIPDIALNTLLSLALSHMEAICDKLGVENDYAEIKKKLNANIKDTFYSAEHHWFYDRLDGDCTKSILGNALAILAGVIEGAEAEILCDKMLSDPSFTWVSLSMQCFFYDALLAVNREKYAEYILHDIEKIYRPMVDYGVGTVWETVLGEADFEQAGSLCHGWSAMPIYYYNILKEYCK